MIVMKCVFVVSGTTNVLTRPTVCHHSSVVRCAFKLFDGAACRRVSLGVAEFNEKIMKLTWKMVVKMVTVRVDKLYFRY